MPELDTMHRRNNQVVGALVFLLLVTASLMGQAQPSQTQSQGTQSIQPTPLPSDVDPKDPAVPVWVPRPAAPPPSANNTAKPGTSTATGKTPSQPGKAPDQPISEGAIVGQVTKDAGGGFVYTSIVNEVTLSATVVDAKHHLVTNLQPTDFVVYE